MTHRRRPVGERKDNTAADAFVEVMGVNVDVVSLEEAVEQVVTMVREGSGGHVVTASADVLHQAQADTELLAVLKRADLVVADGAPRLWLARWQGTPLPDRVNGTDLAVRLLEEAGENGWRVCVLGGAPDVSVRAAKAAAGRYGVHVTGVRSPVPAVMDDPDLGAQVAEWVQSQGADLLFLAAGGGRQDHWIDRHRDRLGPAVAIGVGSALDFISGTRGRAQSFMQSHGLEWAWRVGHEPSRLWHRYLLDDTRVLMRQAR